MTCFWVGINRQLVRVLKERVSRSPKTLAQYLKSRNTRTENVAVQGQKLRAQELDENFRHIQLYNPASVGRGYDCSTSDPFLCLLCEIYRVNIRHTYCGHLVEYTYVSGANSRPATHSAKTLVFTSSRGHFRG